MAITRRDFLKVGTAGLALGTLSPLVQNPIMRRSLEAAMMQGASEKKMLIIFLRGGLDAASLVAPVGDEGTGNGANGYTDVSRPTLYITPESNTQGLEVGLSLDIAPYNNDFAVLSPHFQTLYDEVPLGEELGETDQLIGVIEVIGIDGREDRQLQLLQRVGVLRVERRVRDVVHAKVISWYSFIDGRPQTAQNCPVLGRITVAPLDSTWYGSAAT